MIEPMLYDQARDRIAAEGFSEAVQTKISLLLCTAKNGNLIFHSGVQWLPSLNLVQQFMLSQYSREQEAIALLTRTTRWSRDASLLFDANRIVSPLVVAWSQIMMPPGPMLNPTAAYRGISLGHAQLARIRLTPVIPEAADPLDPFVVALRRIEQENGRMLQTQIRLLKGVGLDMPIEAREILVEQDQTLVDGVFSAFLTWLAAPQTA